MSKASLLQTFNTQLETLIKSKDIYGSRKFRLIPDSQGVYFRGRVGFRVARVKCNAGLDNERLVNVLTPSKIIQKVPWDCPRPPHARIDGRMVSIEAAWESDMQDTDVKLSDVINIKPGLTPLDGSRLFLGFTDARTAVTLHTKQFAHGIVGGNTNSGKSTLLRLIAYLFSLSNVADPKHPTTLIVLLDGKMGQGLGILNGLPGQVGPMAVTEEEWIAALQWLDKEVTRRYELALSSYMGKSLEFGTVDLPRIKVVADEFQNYTEDGRSAEITRLFNKLIVQGRAAGVEFWCGTHKLSLKMFGKPGNATRDAFDTNIGLRVPTATSSRLIRGDDLCTLLLGKGDTLMQALLPNGSMFDGRFQGAYIPEQVLVEYTRHPFLFDRWPTVDAPGREGSRGPRKMRYTPLQYAIAIESARLGFGRNRFRAMLEDQHVGISGNVPLDRLMDEGRLIHARLTGFDYCQTETGQCGACGGVFGDGEFCQYCGGPPA